MCELCIMSINSIWDWRHWDEDGGGRDCYIRMGKKDAITFDRIGNKSLQPDNDTPHWTNMRITCSFNIDDLVAEAMPVCG